MSESIAVERHNRCVTHESSSCSSDKRTTTISIRLPIWLLQRLREKGVSNISRFTKKLLIHEVEGKLTREEQLQYELEMLREEMTTLHNHHKTLLAHGSYAVDYLQQLKDRNIVTHKPFNFKRPTNPVINKEELEVVNETVKLREELSKQYREKLKELLVLKRKRQELTSNERIS